MTMLEYTHKLDGSVNVAIDWCNQGGSLCPSCSSHWQGSVDSYMNSCLNSQQALPQGQAF